jgi:NTE family protein
MAIEINGQKKRIGLALSGGGFRAAAFHLGVFRRLHALKLLDKVDLLSCVSGGSIAGAHLALNWGRGDRLDSLQEYLQTRSVAVASFVKGALDPFHSRLEVLANAYDKHLFRRATLASLVDCPRTYLNATNLATGNMFTFVAGGGGQPERGDHEIGFEHAPTSRLADAVAASSAFPPVFPPMRLEWASQPGKFAVDFVTLADGGIYDNMGVNPTLRARNALDYVIVSDGGKPFDIDEQPTTGSGTMVLRESIDVLMEQVRGLEFDRLHHRHLAQQGPKPLWFSIDSGEGEAQPGDAEAASAVRTHLKRLSAREMEVLTRHGGALVESRLRRYAPELLA